MVVVPLQSRLRFRLVVLRDPGLLGPSVVVVILRRTLLLGLGGAVQLLVLLLLALDEEVYQCADDGYGDQ